MNKIQTRELIQQKFKEYYQENISSIQSPTSMSKREFAFLLFKEKAMLRHKGFKSVGDFRNFLQNIAPSDVYYSSAYFDKPEEEMDAKCWIGADLIFDIDADHIPTPCDKKHDLWTCKNCGTSGRGAKPEKCPKCGGQKLADLSWPCEVCLESAKKETIKLIDVLDSDFGLPPSEMKLAFSGHRGYHVHIESEVVRTLDSMARKEIVDYMMGIGLDTAQYNFEKGAAPNLTDSGWTGRIAKGTYEFLQIATQEQLQNIGLNKKSAGYIVQQRERIQESWKTRGPWKILAGMRSDGCEKIVQQAVAEQSVKIDTVVTTDIHRLIRLANTLHGETGLKKIEVGANQIERFDPFRSAVAFDHGNITVEVSDAPQFRFGDSFYGPYTNQKIELPTAAAMFLLCKGVAKISEETLSVQ